MASIVRLRDGVSRILGIRDPPGRGACSGNGRRVPGNRHAARDRPRLCHSATQNVAAFSATLSGAGHNGWPPLCAGSHGGRAPGFVQPSFSWTADGWARCPRRVRFILRSRGNGVTRREADRGQAEPRGAGVPSGSPPAAAVTGHGDDAPRRGASRPRAARRPCGFQPGPAGLPLFGSRGIVRCSTAGPPGGTSCVFSGARGHDPPPSVVP